MDQFHDYLQEVIDGGKPNLDDVGSLIVMAMHGCGGDWSSAVKALQLATYQLLSSPIGKEAAECFTGAVYHLEIWADPEGF